MQINTPRPFPARSLEVLEKQCIFHHITEWKYCSLFDYNFISLPFWLLQNSTLVDNEVIRSIVHLFLEEDKPSKWFGSIFIRCKFMKSLSLCSLLFHYVLVSVILVKTIQSSIRIEADPRCVGPETYTRTFFTKLWQSWGWWHNTSAACLSPVVMTTCKCICTWSLWFVLYKYNLRSYKFKI